MPEAVKKLQAYLSGLLKGEPRLEYAQLFLKMMVINIYALHHAAEEHVGRSACLCVPIMFDVLCIILTDEPDGLRHYCGLSLGLTLQLTTVLLSACLQRLQSLATPTTLNEGADSPSGVGEGVASESVTTPPAPSEGEEVLGVPGDSARCEVVPSARELPSARVELLDYLSAVLPAIRILYDWFLCQSDLYDKCSPAIKQTVL